MTASHDITHIVRSWIREEEHDSADRVLLTVLSRLDVTPQRRSSWPAWRSRDVKTQTKALLAVAAAVAVAVVGYQFLPRTGVGTGGPSATPLVTPGPTASPAPSPTQLAFPAAGPLAAGVYPAMFEDAPASFTIPTSEWQASIGDAIGKGEYGTPGFVGIDFWLNAPDNVYADPCGHGPLSPPPNATAAALAAAVAGVPILDVVNGPASISVAGHPAQHLVLAVKDQIGCEPHDAHLWYDESTGGALGGWRWAEGLGATYRIWIIDVDGALAWIDAYTFEGAGPQNELDIQSIIDSIRFQQL